MSSLDVTNFNELAVEQQDIRRVHGDTIRFALPFNYASRSPGLAIVVHEKPKFCSEALGKLN